MSTREALKNFSPEALAERFRALGLPGYRAHQVCAWVYQRGVEDWQAMTDLGRGLREELAARFSTRVLEIESLVHSRDGTVKGLLRAQDGALLESVLIPEAGRTTLCLSSQVGCSLACSFCATGAMGLARNLSVAEMVDQFCRMREALPAGRVISNVVFMGMGEPLLNPVNLQEALRTLLHPRGLALAPRRVTVSTVGIAPRIPGLFAQAPINLAVSLHAASDALRNTLVPVGRRFPLKQLFAVLRALPGLSKRRPVLFEYTLMQGVNDAPAEARKLAALLEGLPCKVNLIPMNPHADAPYRPPSPEVQSRFMGVLAQAGVVCTLRRPRGVDIDAACGQLAVRGKHPAPQSAGLAGPRPVRTD